MKTAFFQQENEFCKKIDRMVFNHPSGVSFPKLMNGLDLPRNGMGEISASQKVLETYLDSMNYNGFKISVKQCGCELRVYPRNWEGSLTAKMLKKKYKSM